MRLNFSSENFLSARSSKNSTIPSVELETFGSCGDHIMDPLSISASVLTLLGAGGTLSKLLRKVIDLKNAPDVLRALNDEVSELQSTANDVNDLLWTATQDSDDPPPKSLISSLSRVKSILLQLERYISYQLTTVTADGKNIRLDKSVYLRAERRLHELKDEIHASRIALASALSLFASSIGMRNRIQSRQISCSLESLHNKFEMVPALALRVRDAPQHVSSPQTTLQTIGTGGELLERRPEFSSGSGDLKNRSGITSDATSQSQDYDHQMVVSSELRNQRQVESAPIVQLIQDACNNGCHCPCHSNYEIRSPKLLRTILGSFLLSYRAYPPLKQACGVRCRARAGGISCSYAFPPLLLERVISISYSCALAKGPELLLRVMRKRNFDVLGYLLFASSEPYALEELKRMLDCGEASVLDIDKDGDTILQRAVMRRMWSLAHMLISYGADINYASQEQICLLSAFVNAWSLRWEQQLIQNDIPENWDDLFRQDSTHFDSFEFSSLHKAYLGLSGLSFNQVLASTNRSDIDETDYQGRTVLSWAAARGDSQTVGKLLICGAHPEKKCRRGYSPLHLAVGADHLTAEMLLDARADVNMANDVGVIPIHDVTSRTSSLIKRMVGLGADIEKRDCFGYTPLLDACRCGKAYAVKELLACGADINVHNLHGYTPILLAVFYNHHHVISILLSNPSLQIEADDGNKSNLFSYVAVCGGVQTLLTLRDQWPTMTSFEERFDVHEALQLARNRRDSNASFSKDVMRPEDEDPIAWHEAFMEMINTIIERSKQASHLEDEFWEDAREQPGDPSHELNNTVSA